MPVRELPWENRFDAAVLYDTMHHFDDEVETLRVILRALAPGGQHLPPRRRPPAARHAGRAEPRRRDGAVRDARVALRPRVPALVRRGGRLRRRRGSSWRSTGWSRSTTPPARFGLLTGVDPRPPRAAADEHADRDQARRRPGRRRRLARARLRRRAAGRRARRRHRASRCASRTPAARSGRRRPVPVRAGHRQHRARTCSTDGARVELPRVELPHSLAGRRRGPRRPGRPAGATAAAERSSSTSSARRSPGSRSRLAAARVRLD